MIVGRKIIKMYSNFLAVFSHYTRTTEHLFGFIFKNTKFFTSWKKLFILVLDSKVEQRLQNLFYIS